MRSQSRKQIVLKQENLRERKILEYETFCIHEVYPQLGMLNNILWYIHDYVISEIKPLKVWKMSENKTWNLFQAKAIQIQSTKIWSNFQNIVDC